MKVVSNESVLIHPVTKFQIGLGLAHSTFQLAIKTLANFQRKTNYIKLGTYSKSLWPTLVVIERVLSDTILSVQVY